MINNSHILYSSFQLVVRGAECSVVFIFPFLFERVCLLVWFYGGGGGFINYIIQILKTLMSNLFDEASLTAIRTLQHF